MVRLPCSAHVWLFQLIRIRLVLSSVRSNYIDSDENTRQQYQRQQTHLNTQLTTSKTHLTLVRAIITSHQSSSVGSNGIAGKQTINDG